MEIKETWIEIYCILFLLPVTNTGLDILRRRDGDAKQKAENQQSSMYSMIK